MGGRSLSGWRVQGETVAGAIGDGRQISIDAPAYGAFRDRAEGERGSRRGWIRRLFFEADHLSHVHHDLREWNTATTLGQHQTIHRMAEPAHEVEQSWIVG